MNNEKMEVLMTANDYIYKLKDGIEKTALLIQQEKELEAINTISQIADGLDYITKVMELTKEIHKEEFNVSELNEQLASMVEAFENEDYILLGDLLNYELLPILDNIHNIIKSSIEESRSE